MRGVWFRIVIDLVEARRAGLEDAQSVNRDVDNLLELNDSDSVKCCWFRSKFRSNNAEIIGS